MYTLTDGNGQIVEHPYSVAQLRGANPNTSFPREMTDAQLAEWNVYPVTPTTAPEPSSDYKVIVEVNPVSNGDGTWTQTFEEQDRFTGDDKAAKEAAYAEQLKREAIAKIEADFEAEVADITSQYSRTEIDTFSAQRKEAEAWNADNTVATPFIDEIIGNNNRQKQEQVDLILSKVALYSQRVGRALGTKQRRIADLG